MDLKNDIFVINILLKLSIKSIISCKSVCKTWLDLISDPQFTKLHLAQAKTSLLIRNKSFYLFEFEDDRDSNLRYCWYSKSSRRCHHNIKLSTKPKIPSCKTRVTLNCQGDDNLNVRLTSAGVVNSCDGLLCLVEEEDS
ncbi:F-box domain containing protein [Trema orientale]|uniref:F-box domain containing protein n=1 Tax=Trema orientale TaxID=63057 RepID=A0A2P5ER31_TREOI|nr:F-box domain containing protein [Trema orientale]